MYPAHILAKIKALTARCPQVSAPGSMFSVEWLKLRADQLSMNADNFPCWLLDTNMTCEQWLATNPRLINWHTGEDAGPNNADHWPAIQQQRALALAWWLMDYGLAEALNPALEQARTILGVPL